MFCFGLIAVGQTNEASEKYSEETLKVTTEPITTTEKLVDANLVSPNPSPRVPDLPGLCEAYKLAVGNQGKKLSGVLTEQWLSKDSSLRVSGELKNLFSQLSASRGIDQTSAPDMSPKISLNSEDSLKTLDALQKKISPDRDESGPSESCENELRMLSFFPLSYLYMICKAEIYFMKSHSYFTNSL